MYLYLKDSCITALFFLLLALKHHMQHIACCSLTTHTAGWVDEVARVLASISIVSNMTKRWPMDAFTCVHLSHDPSPRTLVRSHESVT